MAEVIIHKHTVTKYEVTLNLQDLIMQRDELFAAHAIPADATIGVLVPGGGDYSSCTLDAEDTAVRVSWSKEKYYAI